MAEVLEEEKELGTGEETEDQEQPLEDEAAEPDEATGEEEPQAEVEEWMKEGDEADQTDSEFVPLHAHIKAKRKLKGRLSEKDSEIETLKAKVAELEGRQKGDVVQLPKRPRMADYEDMGEYEDALDKYEEQKEDLRYTHFQRASTLQQSQVAAQRKTEQAVDAHYERADKLLKSSGISPDAFKASDQAVREAVESIRAKQGDIIVDQLISRLGEGSEKVMFRLGRSKALLGEFISLLAGDPTGLDAATFLGTQKALLLNARPKLSSAPAPDTQVNGDEAGTGKERSFRKKYDEAHKNKNGQKAWEIKKQAKAAGIDTRDW